MQVALTIWEGRISPLFDATRTLLIAKIDNGRVVDKRIEPFDCESALQRALRLSDLGVDLLICGGISHIFASLIESQGIEIIAFAAGDVDEIIKAYLTGIIAHKKFRMPGCETDGGQSSLHRKRRHRGAVRARRPCARQREKRLMGEVQEIFIDGTRYRVFEESWTAYGEQGHPHFRRPLYRGIIENADGHGRLTGSCGDTLEIFLKFENERVAAASFLGGECASSTICGSLAAELAIGKTPDELAEISGEKILGVLGAFPEEERHCADLAAGALQEALSDYFKRQLQRKQPMPGAKEA